MFNFETIHIIFPAMVVGIIILFTHIPLGQEVLKRGIIFIDLAIAQAAGFGLMLTELLHVEHDIIKELLAVSSAIIAALLFRKIEKHIPQHQEALIGVFYVMMATLSLLALSHHPHGAEHFNTLLSGEMLFVSWQDILSHLPVYIVAMLCWFSYSGARQGLVFYIIFAVVITSSVQLVGVFMVFTVLITPALMIKITNLNWIYGYIISVFALLLGLVISAKTDYPASQCAILAINIINILTLCIHQAYSKAK